MLGGETWVPLFRSKGASALMPGLLTVPSLLRPADFFWIHTVFWMIVCQKIESLNENLFVFTVFLFFFFLNRQKNGLQQEKQRKRILLRNFILNLRRKRTLLIAAVTVVRFIIHWKNFVHYSLYAMPPTTQ